MEYYVKSVIPIIESNYDKFTTTEKTIADFFIHNQKKMDFSVNHIAELLYTSKATLTRFAQKCGYHGYKEFIYQYEETFVEKQEKITGNTRMVLNAYQELLNKSYSLIDEAQIERIVKILTEKKRIYVYGKGSSGTVGTEMKLRFMRIGVNIEAITDEHIMKMNSVLLDGECGVIGISISGKTETVIDSLKAAKKCGAAVVLMTSRKEKKFEDFCDEIMLFAVKENLERGKDISPQFPILVMIDMLYSRILRTEGFRRRETLHEYTMEALDEK